MSLHVIVAYDGPGGSANPSVIYCGRSGDAARAAMDANTSAVRFERIQNPTVIRKHNVNYVAPLPYREPAAPDIVAEQQEAEAASDPPAAAKSSKGWAADVAKAKR